MERTVRELEKVRAAQDPDAVHDLRVAIRRCRSVAAVMEEVDPDEAWPEMRRLGRKLFRQLGALRDIQVLGQWIQKLGPENDAVRQVLLGTFEAKEVELREAAAKVVAKFDQKSWRKLERGLQRRARLVPPDGLAAECLALERLDAAKELHLEALRSGRSEDWHRLRIGVKRFRYVVESLLPRRYEVWGDDLKLVQDLLGEVHDLDVLAQTVQELTGEAPDELRDAWRERITCERNQRVESYRSRSLGKTGLWRIWREGLPLGRRLASAAQARLRATARALDRNPQRTAEVARLALRLYGGLERTRATPLFGHPELRKVMRAATRLHPIGTGLDRNSPQRAARDYLREMAVPAGWTTAEWEILAQVVRYHRGVQPGPKHKSFARLSEPQQTAVCFLAGVLRLARALRKCGVETPVGLLMENSAEAILLRVPGLEDSEHAAARLASGKYLLESCLGRPLIVKPEPVVANVVELPKKEVALETMAVPSEKTH